MLAVEWHLSFVANEDPFRVVVVVVVAVEKLTSLCLTMGKIRLPLVAVKLRWHLEYVVLVWDQLRHHYSN